MSEIGRVTAVLQVVTAVPQVGGNTLSASSNRALASSTAPQPIRQRVECFGQAIMELLECNCCVLARARFPGEEVRLGCVAANQAPVDAISQIVSRKAGQEAVVQSIGPDSAVARDLIGREPAGCAYAVAGAVAPNDGLELEFLAGWRPTALTQRRYPVCHAPWVSSGAHLVVRPIDNLKQTFQHCWKSWFVPRSSSTKGSMFTS